MYAPLIEPSVTLPNQRILVVGSTPALFYTVKPYVRHRNLYILQSTLLAARFIQYLKGVLLYCTLHSLQVFVPVVRCALESLSSF